jgi:hypothetical protein
MTQQPPKMPTRKELLNGTAVKESKQRRNVKPEDED